MLRDDVRRDDAQRDGALRDGALRAGVQQGAAFGRRAPSWGPLALTVGLHLAFVLAWLWGAGRPPVHRTVPEPASAFVLLAPRGTPQAAALRAPRHERAQQGPSRVVAKQATPVAVPPPAMPPAQVRAPAASPAETTQADADAANDGVVTDVGAAAANGAGAGDATAPSPRLPGDLLSSSRRMAGRIDRELRKGASPITAEPDRKWQRFAEAVAGAHVEPPGAVTLARYTAPDGVTIYRKTVGSRVRCYRSGSVGGLGPADGHSAGAMTNCPAGVSWTRL